MEQIFQAIQNAYHISSLILKNENTILYQSKSHLSIDTFHWIKEYPFKEEMVNIYIHPSRIGAVIIPYHETYILLGNLFLGDRNESKLMVLKGKILSEEMKYLESLPEMNLSNLRKLVSMICSYLDIQKEVFIHDSKQKDKIPFSNDHEEEGLVENFKLHQQICDYIKEGKVEELHQLIRYEKFYPKQNTSIETQKVDFIRFLALVTKASYEGGLSLNLSNNLSEEFLKSLKIKNTSKEIHELQVEMMMNFAYALKDVKKKQFKNPLNKRIENYIKNHLYEPINFEAMASTLQISKNYMLSTFKKETNQSLVDYYYEKKIFEAILLLKKQEMTISQVSAYLGFSSHSYFTKWFKKITGKMPKEYTKTL